MSQIKALRNNLFYSPKDQSLIFLWKILRIGGFEKLFELAILDFVLRKTFFENQTKFQWLSCYTRDRNVWGGWFLAANQSNHQNFENSLLTNFDVFSWELSKKKNIFSFEKNFKMAGSKKVHFSKSPILKKILWKILGLVLGLVQLIDAKGIDVAQTIWSWGCLT